MANEVVKWQIIRFIMGAILALGSIFLYSGLRQETVGVIMLAIGSGLIGYSISQFVSCRSLRTIFDERRVRVREVR